MHVASIKQEYKKAYLNMDMLKEKMKRICNERVHIIQSHSTHDILEEFPALQHITIMSSNLIWSSCTKVSIYYSYVTFPDKLLDIEILSC